MSCQIVKQVFPFLLAVFVCTAGIAQTPLNDGAPGYALQLNGIGDCVVVPQHPALNPFPLTFTTWLKSTETNGSKIIFFQPGGYRMMLQNGRVQGFVYKGFAPQLAAVMDPEFLAADGSWHHLGLVVDTNGLRLFIDGNLRDSKIWSSTAIGQPTVTDDLFIGGHPANTNAFLCGLLDETTLWSRALVESELRASMYRRLEGVEPGLVANWRMDSGKGAILEDASANHFDGYLTNLPTWVKSCLPAALGALSVGGPGGYLRTSSLGDDAPTNEVTVEVWARFDTPGTLFSLVPEDSDNRFRASVLSNGAVRWEFGHAHDRGTLDYVPPTPVIGTWQHFAFVSSAAGKAMCIFRNGELEASHRHAGALAPSQAALIIGGATAQVGEFRIWNGALSENEIHDNLHRRLEGAEPGLALYFRFDERAGGSAADQTRRGHDGFLSGQAAWVEFPGAFRPSAATLPPSAVNLSSATLNARINPNGLLTSAWFEWGSELEWQTPSIDVGLGSTVVPFSMPVTGLIAGTTYQYRLVSSNSAGLVFGEPGWFVAALPPVVDTLAPTDVRAEFTETSAALHGSVLPNWSPTLAWFAWGPDVLCLNATRPVAVGNSTNEIAVSAALDHLPAEGIYHYRMVASNTAGVVVGPEKTFWAPGIRLNGPRVMKIRQGSVFEDPGASVSRPIVALSGGSYHCLALTYDGRVIAWGAGLFNSGFPNFGQSSVPQGLDSVVAISAGSGHSLALRHDGRVVAWGSNSHGQSAIPPCVTNAVAIGAGSALSAAVNADGTASTWGSFYVIGGYNPPPELNDVIAVDCGVDTVLYLRREGAIAIWSSDSGCPPVTDALAINANAYVNMVLHRNGTVTLWGNGAGAQPPGLTNVAALANGEHQFLALRNDRTLTGWLADGSEFPIPAGLSNVVAVAASYRTNYALQANGIVTQWGITADRYNLMATNLAPLARPVEVSGTVDHTTPGVYTLRYTAANPWGILGTAARTVIVEPSTPSARQIKSNVLEALNGTLPSIHQGRARELLLDAIEHLSNSLDPVFWIDNSQVARQHGARVFELEKSALLDLDRLLRDNQSAIQEERLREWIAAILEADRLLAVCALEDAVQDDTDQRRVARVWKFISDGDEAAANNNLAAAIAHYRNAWHHAGLLRFHLAVERTPGGLRLVFASVPQLRFEVEVSPDMLNWTAVGDGSAGADGMAYFEQPTTRLDDRWFFRVKMQEQ